MSKIDRLLLYIQKTNPLMTKDRLMEELLVSRSSANSLVHTFENVDKIVVNNPTSHC